MIEVKKHIFNNGDVLLLSIDQSNFQSIGDLIHYTLRYGEKVCEIGNVYYNATGTEYFHLQNYENAIEAYQYRLQSKFPSKETDLSDTLEYIKELG